MFRRLLLVLGLAGAAYGGWLVHHEQGINDACNANIVDPKRGVTVSSQCLNIVWPYGLGFACLILGVLFVTAGLLMTRRIMSGERQYLRDLRAGKFDHENDHLNSLHLSPRPARPPVEAKIAARPRDMTPD